MLENREVPISKLTTGQDFTLVLNATSKRRIKGRLVDLSSCSATVILDNTLSEKLHWSTNKRLHWSVNTPVIPGNNIRKRFPRTPERFPRSPVYRYPRLRKGEVMRYPR